MCFVIFPALSRQARYDRKDKLGDASHEITGAGCYPTLDSSCGEIADSIIGGHY